MNETFYNELFKQARHDLGGGPSDWYGVVANPTSPAAVPLVGSAAFGLLPSSTYARLMVDALVCAQFAYDYEAEHSDKRTSQQSEDTFYFADEVNGALVDATPNTVAALAVAVQVLGVQMGREWLGQGFGFRSLVSAWSGDDRAATDPVLVWVADRWALEPAAADATLDPTRMLGRDLRRITADLSLLQAAAVRVAVAAFETHGYRLGCLVDPTATTPKAAHDRIVSVAAVEATTARRVVLDPWATGAQNPDGPPF